MNELYPIFLKAHELHFAVIGGGKAGTEKVTFIFKNSPAAKVTVISKDFSEEILKLSKEYSTLILEEKEFEENDLQGKQVVIAATGIIDTDTFIHQCAKKQNLLVNVADTPELCDFYLGSIVTKGDLKIAISTNGKSPTLAKRLREFFEDVLPDNINDLVLHLHTYRNSIKGNLEEKIKKLNELTASIFSKKD